ncbi:MAG TPA: AraC family transcriptional regulator [Saprospiraceae bacterium]|nr:AraC family transcriptional regulator [Saprospiraceae bacterium]
MGNSEPILLFIVGAGILQALLLGALLYFHPKGDKAVTSWLALYIISLCLPMFIPVLQQLVSWQMVTITEPVTLLIGPMLVLYVNSFKETITWRKAFPHFILFFLVLLFATYMYNRFIRLYPWSTAMPVEILNSPQVLIRSVIRIGQMAIYYFLARRSLNRYQHSIEHLYSETSRINLGWVRWLINGYLVLMCTGIVFYFLMRIFPLHFNFLFLANLAFVCPYIYLVTIKGMTQPTLWQVHPEWRKEKIEQEFHEVEALEHQTGDDKSKNVKTGLPSEKTTDIVARTLNLMEKDKLFQESELSLQDLADKLQQPAYIVSQAINDGLQKSFYDLVNGYRVEEAKRLLRNPENQNYKILSVGFEAGFNSKTTFNTVFKKFTGFSPSDYREQHTAVQ